MKKIIRLTESDLTHIVKRVIKESNNTNELIYITKNENKLTQEVYSRSIGTYQNPFSYITVPPNTKFEFGLYNVGNTKMYSVMAWGGKLSHNCSGFFSDREGNRYKSTYLNQALKNKFCDSSGQFKKSLFDIYKDKNTEKDLSKIQDVSCVNKIKEPYKNAVNWWKNKLNEPAFYEKLKKLNNYTDQQTKEWITKYKNYLTNNISGPFCPSKTSKWYKENIDNEIAHLAGNVGSSRVVYNVIYKDETSKDIEATMVHEIQHAFYDLKPMTPDSNWKKVFPYKVWGGSVVNNSESPSPKEKTTISKYGLDQNVINYWKNQVKLQTDPKNNTMDDVGYLCRITELASRVVTMKNLLNKKTKDKITVDEFKKFLKHDEVPYNDENAYWLCLCWVNNGMEDIQTFLDNLDKYVVAKVDTKNNDNMKDGVS